MSNTIQGKVQQVRQNDKGIWGVKVDGTWYSTYKTEPKVSEGDEVTFEASQNGQYWNANAKTLKRVGRASGGSSGGGEGATTPAKSSGYSGNGYNSPERLAADEKRQREIGFQSARNAAIEFLGFLHTAGLLALAGNKAEQLGIAELYLAKYTNQFYADTQQLVATAPNREAGATKGATTARKAAPKATEPEPDNDNGDGGGFDDDELPEF
jgi:hypothetical protein